MVPAQETAGSKKSGSGLKRCIQSTFYFEDSERCPLIQVRGAALAKLIPKEFTFFIAGFFYIFREHMIYLYAGTGLLTGMRPVNDNLAVLEEPCVRSE